MFTRQIFETLPIAVIAAGILLLALFHSLPGLLLGTVLILGGVVMLIRRYIELGTDPDVLDYVPPAHKPHHH